jgi:hypothetical protein
MRQTLPWSLIVALLTLGLMPSAAAHADGVYGGSVSANAEFCTGPVYLDSAHTYQTSGDALTIDGLYTISVKWNIQVSNRAQNNTYTKLIKTSGSYFQQTVDASTPGIVLPTFVISCIDNNNSVPVTFSLENTAY